MRTFGTPPPPPMPDVAPALLALADAKEATSRYIWNKAQLADAIRSAEFHLNRAKIAAGLLQDGKEVQV